MARKRLVEFCLDMPSATEVSVAGTFNNWKVGSNPLYKAKDGMWRSTIPLTSGRHEYRFVVDGKWISDPKAAGSAPNPYGSSNSVLKV